MWPNLDLAALRNPSFRLVALAQSGFVAGEQLIAVAVTVSVLQAGGDASTLGLVMAAKGVASLIFLLAGGVWADRLPRRRLLVAMFGVDAIVSLGPVLILPRPQTWFLASVLFVVGAAESFIRPAFDGLLRTTLTDDQRLSGRSVVNLCTRLGVIVGPSLGVALVARAGADLAFVVAALLFASAALAVWRVIEAAWTPMRGRSMLAEAVTGIAEVWRRPWLTALLLFSPIGLMFIIAPSQVLLPVLSRHTFGSFTAYGTALTFYGVGGLIASIGMMMRQWRRPGTVAMWSLTLYALVPLGLLHAPSIWVLFACYLVAGLGVETYALTWNIATQREIPDHLMGRITSLAWLSTFGLMPFGQALTGPLTHLVGAAVLLSVAAGLVLVIPPCLLFVRGMAQMSGTRRSGFPRRAP